jgi:undecaprenyl-diphosphatase
MAVQVRFLQRQGVDKTVVVSGVGLNTLAGVIGHVTLIGVFIVWAGRDAFGSLRLPDPTYFLIGLGVVAVMFVIGVLIPQVRAMMIARVQPIVTRAYGG